MKNKKNVFALIIIVLQLFFSLVIAVHLPADVKIPTHWNMKGEIDGYSSKWVGILLFPIMNLLILGMLRFMPIFSVRYKNSADRFEKVIPNFTLILVGFFALIHIFTLLVAIGFIGKVNQPIFILMGFLFIFLGNFLPKVPSNFYLGIRTPWSLSSETVWRKTHRVGGICFVISGIMMIIASLIGEYSQLLNQVLITTVFVIIFIPIVLSFVWYKKENA